jgi:excisionase family DNA binding protein
VDAGELDGSATYVSGRTTKGTSMQKLALSPSEAAECLGLSRQKVYDLLNAGERPVKKVGTRSLIPVGPSSAATRAGLVQNVARWNMPARNRKAARMLQKMVPRARCCGRLHVVPSS